MLVDVSDVELPSLAESRLAAARRRLSGERPTLAATAECLQARGDVGLAAAARSLGVSRAAVTMAFSRSRNNDYSDR